MPPAPRSRTSYMAHRDGEAPAADDPLLGFAPVPHKQLRRNSIGPERQRAFVAQLAACGIVTQAAKHIGASMEALYKLRHRPGAEEFAAAWDDAVDRGVRRLEDCALARAIAGEPRLVVSGGKVLGREVRHNEALVMFFLRNRLSGRYGHVAKQALKPGHPEYERIRRDVLAEDYEDEQETLDSIDQFIEDMRQRRLANTAVLAEWDAENAPDQADAPEEEPAAAPAGPKVRATD